MILAILLVAVESPILSVPAAALMDDRVTAPESRLVWPEGTRVVVEERDGEVVARFDRPLSEAAIASFREAAGDGVGDLRWNDDSLLLRPAEGWRITLRHGSAVLGIAFVPPSRPASIAVNDGAAHDAELVGIEAAAAAGYPGQARRTARALAARYPDDRRVARAVADTRLADGDVRGAARDYRALAADDRTARRAIAAAPGTASVGVTVRDGSDLAQAEFAARADASIGRRIGLGGGVRHIVTDIATTNGTERRGGTVADVSLGLASADAIRVQLLGSAAFDDAVAGGGARVLIGSAEAQVRAGIVRHMPDFSTPAQVLAGGYLSRAALGFTYRLTPGVLVQGDVGANRYGLAGATAASDTTTASGGIDYLIRRQFPALGLTYRYEAEYVERMRRGADGGAIVPLATRENHTVQALVSAAVGDVQMTGLAGWTVDRFGGDGPTASIGIAAPIGILWRVEGSGGITSIARPGFSGRQIFARAQLTRSLGDGR